MSYTNWMWLKSSHKHSWRRNRNLSFPWQGPALNDPTYTNERRLGKPQRKCHSGEIGSTIEGCESSRPPGSGKPASVKSGSLAARISRVDRDPTIRVTIPRVISHQITIVPIMSGVKQARRRRIVCRLSSKPLEPVDTQKIA